MNYLVWILAIPCALILTGPVLSLFALYRIQLISRELHARRADPAPGGIPQADAELRGSVAALAAKVHELQCAPANTEIDPAVLRPGLNLSKRSQAIRLHRRGENADQIAAELQVPRQEVDLLLKVHQIVLSSV